MSAISVYMNSAFLFLEMKIKKKKTKLESLSLENSVQKSRKIVSYIPGCFGIIVKKAGTASD